MKNRLDIKILFIDDEEDVRDISKEIMVDDYGYKNFDLSHSIEDAQERFMDNHFDILIIDMRFQGRERGFELLTLGEDEKNIASNMIIFTANDEVMACRKAFKMGAWDYIPKNLTEVNSYEELHSSIQEAIKHTEKWGNDKDSHWVNEHIDELIEQYEGKYLCVMDNEIIAQAQTREEIENVIKEKNLPTLMPLIFKVD